MVYGMHLNVHEAFMTPQKVPKWHAKQLPSSDVYFKREIQVQNDKYLKDKEPKIKRQKTNDKNNKYIKLPQVSGMSWHIFSE